MTNRTALIFGAACALMATSAFAQEGEAPAAAPDAEKINMVIVYGEDECAASTDDQINVCARLSESDRYRIPTQLRDDPNDPRKEDGRRLQRRVLRFLGRRRPQRRRRAAV